MVSIALLLVGAFVAPQAGRVDDGFRDDGLWRSAELEAAPRAQSCSQSISLGAREIVFERVQPGDLDIEEIRQIAAGDREVVQFKWNAATGELTYDTTAQTGVFSDLVSASAPSDRNPAICESR